MAAYKGLLIDKLVAKNGDMFISDSKAGYNDAYDYSLLPDNAWITKLMLITAIGGASQVVQIPFTTTDLAPTLTINWQTDIPAGYSSTYAALLGNYFPKSVAYVLSSGTTYINQGTIPTVTYDGTLINTVVFDFGGASSGFIRF